jgi:hypothetical protein
MEAMTKMLVKILMIIAIVLLLGGGICLIRKIVKKRQNSKELYIQANDKIRDENLNNVILNNYHSKTKTKESPKPYDVDYGSRENGKVDDVKNIKKKKKQLMIQLIEKTELSTRKFMLDSKKGIRIGSDTQGNDITIYDSKVAPHQCEIFEINNKIYVRSLSSQIRIFIIRKKESAIVDEKGIRLLSNDKIIIGNVTYSINIIK